MGVRQGTAALLNHVEMEVSDLLACGGILIVWMNKTAGRGPSDADGPYGTGVQQCKVCNGSSATTAPGIHAGAASELLWFVHELPAAIAAAVTTRLEAVEASFRTGSASVCDVLDQTSWR